MRILLVVPTYLYQNCYPVFVSPGDFPAGFAYLAAVLKQAGYEVFGVNPNNDPGFSSAREMATTKIRAAILEYSPDLIGIGGLCTDFPFLKNILEEIRKICPHTPVVMGGGIINHDAEFVFQKLRPDFCIVGEAEEPIVQLVKSIQAGDGNFAQIKNLGFWSQNQAIFTPETDQFPDLDNLPFPDYSPFDIDTSLKYSITSRYLYRYTRAFPRQMTLVAARSCPFNCSFCVHKQRSRYRARSIGNIMEEIHFLYDRYQFNVLVILDELFAANKARLEEFCQTLIEYRSKEKWDFDWLFQTHANARLDKKCLLLARDAGCYFFSYGMESASPTVLASMNKKI
jgi:anaerobic magnesium-protoporphyrin IX monomethyl ester cyclase